MNWVETLVTALEDKAGKKPLVVHRWTLTEIMAYHPPFGDGGWFYGIIKDKKQGLVLGEIFPQTGYSVEEETILKSKHVLKMVANDLVSKKPKWTGKDAVERAAKVRARQKIERKRQLDHEKRTANCKHYPHWQRWAGKMGHCAHCGRMFFSKKEWQDERSLTGKTS